MCYRSLMLAGAAIIALCGSANAQNTVTTTQIGGVNVSTTTQDGRTLNTATLTQSGFSNTGTVNQGLTMAGITNRSTITQVGQRTGNVASVSQFSTMANFSEISQAVLNGSNTASVGQISMNGFNSSIVNQMLFHARRSGTHGTKQRCARATVVRNGNSVAVVTPDKAIVHVEKQPGRDARRIVRIKS